MNRKLRKHSKRDLKLESETGFANENGLGGLCHGHSGVHKKDLFNQIELETEM
jgi:hypothetical protein